MDEEGLTNLSLTEADLINLQQAGVLVSNQGTPHFTQTDLETLASIQDDLETFSMEATQQEMADIAELAKDVGIGPDNPLSGLGLDMDQLGSAVNSNLGAVVTSSTGASNEIGELQKTVQIVKSPMTPQQQGGFSKLRAGSGTQQIRIQPSPAGRTITTSQLGNSNTTQPMKFLNILPATANKSKDVPTTMVNILNADGSISTMPVNLTGQTDGSSASNTAGQPLAVQLGGAGQSVALQLGGTTSQPLAIQLGNQQMRGGPTIVTAPRLQNQQGNPAVRLITSTGQSFRVISGGKLSAPESRAPSPKKPIQLKPEQGQVIRTADGRLIAFSSGSKNIVLQSPSKQIGSDKVIRVPGEALADISSNKVQLVRVINQQGETVQLKMADKQKFQQLQGIKTVSSATPFQTSLQKEIAQVKKEMVSVEPPGLRPRKPCNCTKSQCLKLYCDCFANGEFCFNCNCNNCHNNLENEEERQRSIRQCLDRNPYAFQPKIGKNPAESDRRHNKGCNCKRSGCLKNYCECYEAKIICTDICKCVGCKNVDERTGSKMTSLSYVEELPDESLSVSEKWFKPTTSLRSKLLHAPSLNLQEVSTSTSNGNSSSNSNGVKKQPFSFVTQEVVEATCQCLLAQAEEGERLGLSELQIEQQVLEEFGRCLSQIIDFAGSARKT